VQEICTQLFFWRSGSNASHTKSAGVSKSGKPQELQQKACIFLQVRRKSSWKLGELTPAAPRDRQIDSEDRRMLIAIEKWRVLHKIALNPQGIIRTYSLLVQPSDFCIPDRSCDLNSNTTIIGEMRPW
jgi:hypothetical protein